MARGRLYRTRLTAATGIIGRLYQAGLTVAAEIGHGRLYQARLDAPGTVTPPSPRTVKSGAFTTLTATASGTTTSWEWSQQSGPTVTLTGSGNVRTFTAPYLTATTPVVIRVRAVFGGTPTPWESVTITIAKHPAWVKRGGILLPALPGTPHAAPSDGLWFALPATIRQHQKKVFAHYFGPYPRSINNAATIATDNYTVYFNNPSYSPYSAVGGMFRDRPLWRPQIGGDYKLTDCAWDIRQAKAAGIDGFAPDLLGLSGSNYDNYETLRNAALQANAADPANPFYVVPMVDANGATAAASAQAAAAYVKRFCLGAGGMGSTPLSSAYFTPEGKYLVSAFKGEGKELSYWRAMLDYLKTDWGINAVFMPCYVNWNLSANYSSIQYGSGSWGYGADPAVIANATNMAAAARARGEVYFAPIASQDVRPGIGTWFDEALGTGAQRAAWTKAIGQDAEYAQIVTWSDYSETPCAPSAANGWTVLDLHAWYITRWKTGQYPTILRDAVLLSHRSRTLTMTATAQTNRLAQKARGSQSPVTNLVEIVTFLTGVATVQVQIGASSYSYTAPAGMSVQTYPVPGVLSAGSITVTVLRAGSPSTSVTSPIAIRSTAPNDDYGYYRFSSLRGTAGQFDPSTAY